MIPRLAMPSLRTVGIVRMLLLTTATVLGLTTFGGMTELYSNTGKLQLSVDGGGDLSDYAVDVRVPYSATSVEAAYLISASIQGVTTAPTAVTLDGMSVSFTQTVTSGGFTNAVADVTSIVQNSIFYYGEFINVATSSNFYTVSLTVSEGGETASIDGVVLAVIFSVPTQVENRTIILQFGQQTTTGDSISVSLNQQIPVTGVADMGLGIGFSYQPDSQTSTVTVNGTLVSSKAGGYDDGNIGSNGSLITVGGVGDANNNPGNASDSDPASSESDDELYNLIPFIDNTATSQTIQVATTSSETEENIFFAHFVFSASELPEAIALTPNQSSGPVGTSHTVTATLIDDTSNAISGRNVVFEIVAGPNAGLQSSPTATNSGGQATWTYVDVENTPGTDIIEASFLNQDGDLQYSNQVSMLWGPVSEYGQQLLNLKPAWNLVFISVDPSDPSVSSLFGSGFVIYELNKSGTDFDVTYRYDLVTNLQGGRAYWIYNPESTDESIIIEGFFNGDTSVLLTRAWNMFGTHDTRTLPATASILAVYYWNAASQAYARPSAGSTTGSYQLEGGRGHFAFAIRPIEIIIQDER